jgi:hypothetical protein
MNGAGKPLSEELTRLQSIFDTRMGDIADLQRARPDEHFIGPMNAHPEMLRSIGQETANRVEDELTKWSPRVFQEIQDAMKINQVPAAFAVRDNIEKIIKGIARDYPTWENAVHNMRFEADSLGNIHSTTYFGRTGTELFSSLREAQTVLKNNFNKFGTATVQEVSGPTLPRELPKRPIKNGKPEELTRHPQDVFVGELSDDIAKDTFNKAFLWTQTITILLI